MKPELADQLYNKYPKLFVQKDLSASETCMCWGICTPDGWFDILDRLCYNIQSYCDSKGIQVEATQVKIKLSTLRFYFTNPENREDWDYISDLINAAEDETAKLGAFETEYLNEKMVRLKFSRPRKLVPDN